MLVKCKKRFSYTFLAFVQWTIIEYYHACCTSSVTNIKAHILKVTIELKILLFLYILTLLESNSANCLDLSLDLDRLNRSPCQIDHLCIHVSITIIALPFKTFNLSLTFAKKLSDANLPAEAQPCIKIIFRLASRPLASRHLALVCSLS